LVLGVILCSFYVNAQFPIVFEAFLNGSNVVPLPNVTSNATGHGYVALDPSLTSMLVTIDADTVVNPTLAHIHIGPTTVSGPVCVNLTSKLPTFIEATYTNADTAVFNYTFAQVVADIEASDTYFNVHSAAYPNGEIRGQLYLSTNFFVSNVNTTNVVIPCNGTFSSGIATILVNPTHTRVTINIQLNNLTFTPTTAYIYIGAPGQNGNIVVNLTSYLPFPINVTTDISPTLLINATQLQFATALFSGNIYVSVNSAACPNGQARGQIYPQSAISGSTTTTGSTSASTTGSGATTTGGATTGTTAGSTSSTGSTTSTTGNSGCLQSWLSFLYA